MNSHQRKQRERVKAWLAEQYPWLTVDEIAALPLAVVVDWKKNPDSPGDYLTTVICPYECEYGVHEHGLSQDDNFSSRHPHCRWRGPSAYFLTWGENAPAGVQKAVDLPEEVLQRMRKALYSAGKNWWTPKLSGPVLP